MHDQIPRSAIDGVAFGLGIPFEALFHFGHHVAKVSHRYLASLSDRPDGRLILVSAINPTPAGEGKTTTSIGLADGLARIGKRPVLCLREPSLGPVFGRKGGATGGGRSAVIPADDINLHFTGDIHAVSTAHNLLAALIDNNLHWGNGIGLDPASIVWRRAIDLNDRALRQIEIGRGNKNGPVRTDGFDISVASEVMAILCLATSIDDLKRRLGDILIGRRMDGTPVLARDLEAADALAALLKRAMDPNLVATAEGTPAFIHGGPFANIAHGCNSLVATRGAMKLGDYVITEAGFGADLGAEKFLDIKCRIGGISPSAAVVVATIRALKMHGDVAKDDLGRADTAALERGFANLVRHVENLRSFGLPVVVAINHFSTDTDGEIAALEALCAGAKIRAVLADPYGSGGLGCEKLAEAVVEVATPGPVSLNFVYSDDMKPAEKIRAIARRIYRARDIVLSETAERQLKDIEAMGFGRLPVCIAKTQFSFTADPKVLGAPTDHTLPVREVMLARGAGFIVVLTGDMLRMPGLPREPASKQIRVTSEGVIEGMH